MLYPAVSEFKKKTENRYELVIAVAKRARQIVKENEEKIENTQGLTKIDVNDKYFASKPVKLAINEFSKDKFKVVR